MAATDATQQQMVVTTIPTGYGYSLLDSVLHSRVVHGRVRSTATRVMYCGRLASGAGSGGGAPGGKAAAGAQAAAQAAALGELMELNSAVLLVLVSVDLR
jgi:hypothetical protein